MTKALPATLSKVKYIRFSELVKLAGKPEVITLWADPNKDRAFMQLVKQHRVVTIVQKPRGIKRDFGFIGFHPQPFAAFMVFPRRIVQNDGLQIIGIKYDLIESLAPHPVKTFKPKILPKPKPVPKRPAEKSYRVTIARTLIEEIEISAVTMSDAKTKALEQAAALELPKQSKSTSNKIVRIEPAD